MKTKIILLTAIIVFIIIPLYYFLFHFNLFEGEVGRSGSIKNAKKLNVFVAEYEVDKDSIHFSNNDYLIFDDIWLEKLWMQGKSHDEVVFSNKLKNNYTLYLSLPNNKKILLKKCGDKVGIIDTSMSMLGVYQFGDYWCIFRDWNNSYFTDSIKFLVITPDLINRKPNEYKWNNPIVIDSFYLIKKSSRL